MRTILSVIVAVLYCILTLPAMGVLALIGIRHPDTRDRAAKAMIQWIFRVLLACAGTSITAIGVENIPEDRAVLFVGNHRSIYDIISTYTYMPRITGYVAKQTLNEVPIFNVWARWIHCLFFNRNNLKEGMQMLLDGAKMIQNGISVFIFPEGTRSKIAEDTPLLEFHEGSFRIATKAGCPIIPVAICNTRNIFEAHLPWLKKQHIVIEFCDPIDPTLYSRKEQKRLGEKARAVITETIEKNEPLV